MSGRFVFWFVVTTLVVFLIGCAPETPAPAPTEIPPTVQPLPGFMIHTNPAAATSVSWATYTAVPDEFFVGPPTSSMTPNSDIVYGGSRACVGFSVDELIELGDNFFDHEAAINRTSLFVDGGVAGRWREYGAAEPLNQWVDESGKVLASWSGPYTVCWQVELEPGRHEAEFQFRQTSGTVQSYRWFFDLTVP